MGRATTRRLDRSADAINLSGGVHIKSLPGTEPVVRIDCERLIYRRAEGLVRMLEDVYARFGDQELKAFTVAMFLDQDRGLRTLRARWDVSGRLTTTDELGDPSRVDFAAEFLEVEPSTEAGVRGVKLEGGDGTARVKIVDASGLASQLSGQYLESLARGGELQRVEGFGDPLVFEEFLDFDQPFYLRQACARHVSAQFGPDGSLGYVYLEHDVELRTEDLHMSGGAKADLDINSGQIGIRGDEVELFSKRGSVLAPEFTYNREKQLIRASSGVRATLRETDAFEDTLLGRGAEGPIRVESREALWTGEPAVFSFRGGVRAWRGPNLLLADQLRGDETAHQLAASGGVKTVWIPSPGASGADAEPIEVFAESMSYRPTSAGRPPDLIYTGEVRVQQASRNLSCHELAVEFEAATEGSRPERSKPERMICREDVRLSDPAASRQVQGDTAVFTVAEQQIEVFGDSVELIDQRSNSLVGKYLMYDLDAGTVHLRSRPPAGAGR